MSAEHQEKRRRQRLCIRVRRLHQRADRLCGPIGQFDTLLSVVTDLAGDANRLLTEDETISLLDSNVRSTLEQAIGRLEQVKEYTAIPADICDGLDKAFQDAENVLESFISAPSYGPAPVDGKPTWVKLALGGTGIGIIGVAGVLAAAVIGTVTINVRNVDCADILIPDTVAGVVAVLPFVKIPNSLPEAETAVIQLPKGLSGTLAVKGPSEMTVRSLGLEVTFPTGDLDLNASTWDGTPLERSVSAIPLSGEHNLVLKCRR